MCVENCVLTFVSEDVAADSLCMDQKTEELSSLFNLALALLSSVLWQFCLRLDVFWMDVWPCVCVVLAMFSRVNR